MLGERLPSVHREPCLLSLLSPRFVGWLRLFFFLIGCRLWAALLNSSSPPSRYPQTPDAVTRTVWGRSCRTSVPVLLWPMSPPNACEGSSSSAGGTLRLATWNSRLAAVGSFRRWAQAQGWIRGSVGGDRTPPAGAGRHHTDPLRTAARPVDPGGYPRSGEDAVADAVRNRGPG